MATTTFIAIDNITAGQYWMRRDEIADSLDIPSREEILARCKHLNIHKEPEERKISRKVILE